MAMVKNITQNIEYDDSTYLTSYPNTSFVIKRLITRREFMDVVHNVYEIDYEVIHRFCVSTRVDEKLTKLLRNYVKEKYSVLDASIQLDETQYDILFPENHSNRLFYVVIHFQDIKTINKMKLKYPDVMSEITGL